MNKRVNLFKGLAFILFGLAATNVWSYGGGGGQASKCKKPTFKDMTPPKSSVVPPGAEFAFTASSNTNPKSIKVVVKGHEVNLDIKKSGNIKVSGNLPAEITEGYARVNISASSSAKCSAKDGWLLQIGE